MPLINLNSYGDSSINIEYIVWVENKGYYDYCNIRGNLMQYIVERFGEKNIEIPYNKLDIYFHNSEIKKINIKN